MAQAKASHYGYLHGHIGENYLNTGFKHKSNLQVETREKLQKSDT